MRIGAPLSAVHGHTVSVTGTDSDASMSPTGQAQGHMYGGFSSPTQAVAARALCAPMTPPVALQQAPVLPTPASATCTGCTRPSSSSAGGGVSGGGAVVEEARVSARAALESDSMRQREDN